MTRHCHSSLVVGPVFLETDVPGWRGSRGLSLLITRSRLARRALGPLAAAGAMTLTLYTAHVIVLETTSFLEDHPIQLFLVLAYLALSFAALWRQDGRPGPLEAMSPGPPHAPVIWSSHIHGQIG